MTIFRLNFLLKVAHILVCQNPSFISTPDQCVCKSWVNIAPVEIEQRKINAPIYMCRQNATVEIHL